MADASAVRCCSSIPSFRSFSRSRGREPGWARQLFLMSSSSPRLISPLRGGHAGFRVGCCSANPDDAGTFGGDDAYGFYPWDPRNSSGRGDAIQWMPEEQITLFTTDGLIQIGGSLVPRRRKQPKSKIPQKFQRFQESDYMDPNQSLCLGALFDIAATNGLDTGRRLCIFGFCRSIEMLSNVVEDAVLGHGGEVVAAVKASKGGLQEKLTMIVAVPLLWGVPPASETLHVAVRSGGGIVEKVYWQWDFL